MQQEELELYEVTEEEEEIFTLDFENNTAITKQEFVCIKEEASNTPLTTIEVASEPLKPTFQQEIENTFFNKLTSKAIASLISKQRELDTDIEEAISSKRMGKLNDILDREVSAVLNKRRQELRNCYAGPIVKYDRIPDWAKGYIKEYIENMIHDMDSLLNDN